MKTRVLKPEEWGKFEGDQLPPMFPYVSPENVDIVAVEDDEGSLIACMTVLRVTHFEGAWVNPAHKGAGATRAMLRLASAIAQSRGEQWVFGGANEDTMRGILQRMGGRHVPMELFALWVGDEGCQGQQ